MFDAQERDTPLSDQEWRVQRSYEPPQVHQRSKRGHGDEVPQRWQRDNRDVRRSRNNHRVDTEPDTSDDPWDHYEARGQRLEQKLHRERGHSLSYEAVRRAFLGS